MWWKIIAGTEEEMEEGTTNSTIDRYAKLTKGSWCSQFYNGSNPWMARYVYGLMFLVATFLAWAVRDYGHSALKEMERLKGCGGGKECLGTEGVLRVSLGCFKKWELLQLEINGMVQLKSRGMFTPPSSGWYLKVVHTKRIVAFWMVVCQDSFDDWTDGAALFCSFSCYSPLWLGILRILVPGITDSSSIFVFKCIMFSELVVVEVEEQDMVFLLIQLISIISFITWINDYHIQVMLLATTAYVLCIMGIISMYIWYAPDSSCLLNIFFITWTLVLLQLMTSVSLHPKVNAGFLTPGLMGLYVVFLCWSAIRSEPPEEKCIKKVGAAAKGDWLTIISLVVGVLAIVIATFSTGIDSQCFQVQFKKKERESEDDVPYGFGFFHFVFATGAMYFAMLLIGWNTHHTMKRWTIDVGWTSTWVRIVNEWLAVCLYIWMLVAPIVWKSRQSVAESV
ncbi:unnamed protein product [Camellia sinensis]